jgi:hypothetical protein
MHGMGLRECVCSRSGVIGGTVVDHPVGGGGGGHCHGAEGGGVGGGVPSSNHWGPRHPWSQGQELGRSRSRRGGGGTS